MTSTGMDLTLLKSTQIQIYIYLAAKEAALQNPRERPRKYIYKYLQAKLGSKCNKDVFDVI